MRQSQAFIGHFLDTLPIHKRFFIPAPDGSPYLERIVLEEAEDGSKVYLHILYQSDGDRDLHDHPWNFVSHIIYGEYIEHRSDGSKQMFFAGDTNEKEADTLHRLELPNGPVITMIECGPKIREWGFQTEEGWVHHKDYLDKKFGPGNWDGEYE